jgi:hypothetical protein
MVVFALRVVPDFENHRAQTAPTPSDCAELFRIVALLVNQVHLIEYFLRLFEANAMFSLDTPALLAVEQLYHHGCVRDTRDAG